MADLGRADAVQELETRTRAPALEDRRRECLPGADAETYRAEVERGAAVHCREHVGVSRRHAEEERRPVASHLIRHDLG